MIAIAQESLRQKSMSVLGQLHTVHPILPQWQLPGVRRLAAKNRHLRNTCQDYLGAPRHSDIVAHGATKHLLTLVVSML